MSIFFVILLLFVNYLITNNLKNRHPNLYLARFLYYYYVIEILVGLMVLVCDKNFLLPVIHFHSIPVREILPKWSLVVLVAGIFIRFGVSCACIGGQEASVQKFRDRYEMASYNFPVERISDIFAVIFCLSVLFPFIPQFPYALRIITLSFDFLPIFVGLYYTNFSNKRKLIWIVLLFINMSANLVQASRGLAVIPIALFMIGYLLSISDKKVLRKRLVVILLISAPFFSIFGKFQDFRDEYGRGNDVTAENADMLLQYMFYESKTESKPFLISVADGLGRFINVGDFAIVHMTPNPVSHRGFIQMTDEIEFAVTLYGAEGRNAFRQERGDLMYGSGVLSAYGFSINETTSVGMGILGDAYSRFGIIGVALYLFFLAFAITKIEIVIARRYPSIFGILLFLFLSYTFLYTIYGNSYFVFLKKILFNGVLVFFVSKSITYKNILH